MACWHSTNGQNLPHPLGFRPISSWGTRWCPGSGSLPQVSLNTDHKILDFLCVSPGEEKSIPLPGLYPTPQCEAQLSPITCSPQNSRDAQGMAVRL